MDVRTPRLDVKSDNRLGCRLYFAGLLLVVLSQTLGLYPLSLRILLLIVAAEQVDLVVILLGSLLGCLGRVDGELRGLRAIGGVLLGWVARQGLKLALEGEDVVVPAPCVRELLWGRDLLDLLEDLDVGLRWSVAVSC